MKTINRLFYRFLFPTKRDILRKPRVSYDYNNIIFKNIIIFGYQGSGKTSTANAIASVAVKRYGERNVNAVMSEEGDLNLLMNYGLQDKLVNILFADNLTLRKLNRSELMEYFRIRHKAKNSLGMSNGYILSMLALHRFHSIPVELRTNMDALIVKDSSMNPYDRNILKKFIGKEHLDMLDYISINRDHNPKLKALSIFCNKSIVGVIKLPLCRRSYLSNISRIDILRRIRC